MKKAVFFDRDGVLNETEFYDGCTHPPKDADSIKIMPNAGLCIAQLQKNGFLCICVTNQPDYARGSRTLENIKSMNERVRKELGLDDIYVCLHDNSDNCVCRKPKPGMLFKAAREHGLNLVECWMVGDRESDIRAGISAECHTIFFHPHSRKSQLDIAEFECDDLMQIPQIILSRNKTNEI